VGLPQGGGAFKIGKLRQLRYASTNSNETWYADTQGDKDDQYVQVGLPQEGGGGLK